MSDYDGFRSKCSIFNGEIVHIEKTKVNIPDT